MNWQRGLGIGVLLGAALACAYVTGSVTAQRPLVTSDEINTVEVTRSALPATVQVNVRIRADALQQGDNPNETGSGFFYKANLIVTNYHVIKDQESLSVTLSDGRSVPAKVVGSDPGIDIAVLRVSGVSAPKLLSFGDSSRLVLGQKFIAIGSPLKYQNFISTGAYSKSSSDVPRDDQLGGEVGEYMLTTAMIQGGNSGGPVLDSRGAVVGVADANAAPSQLVPGIIGVVIPANIVKQSLTDLETVGVSQRGTLGVSLQNLGDLDPALRQLAGLSSSNGALVNEVPAGSAGARSGLRGSLKNNEGQLLAPLGDVVVAVDGVRIKNSYDVVRRVATKRPGQIVTLTVWRNKKEVQVPVTLLKRTLAQ
ncbi:serine protease [Deinococcus detaillensis]|uniref:Serine protease n=1 Tax=Deinococcus detaillensis TaxID=2592048 RepID=A0A553V3Y2_9DEIO|nr:S1C family serine protease [Deinococcus detaillensis]TSA87169.1 serine protease [Deinococcus detaillensis]